ncbi:MAG: hypothetical protein ACPIOQ_24830 [Promethearchaeia archaeon]
MNLGIGRQCCVYRGKSKVGRFTDTLVRSHACTQVQAAASKQNQNECQLALSAAEGMHTDGKQTAQWHADS